SRRRRRALGSRARTSIVCCASTGLVRLRSRLPTWLRLCSPKRQEGPILKTDRMGVAVALVALAVGCIEKTELDGDACKEPYALTGTPTGPCDATVDKLPDSGFLHFDTKYDKPRFDIVYHCSNPPASGDHLPSWGRWRTHSTPLARGHYVHNLEH